MALGYILSPFIQVNDIKGKPICGAKIYVYDANTSEPAVTYSDFDLHFNTNPVLTNELGNATIIATDQTFYNVVIHDENDVFLMSKMNIAIDTAAGQVSDVSVSAGNGIEVNRTGNVFTVSVDTDIIATQDDLANKQDKLAAGDNISLDNNTVSVVNRREFVAADPLKFERSNNRLKIYLDNDFGDQFKTKQDEVHFGGESDKYISYITQDENGNISATVSPLTNLRDIQDGYGINITTVGNTETVAIDQSVVALKSDIPTIPTISGGYGIDVVHSVNKYFIMADTDVLALKSDIPSGVSISAGDGIDITEVSGQSVIACDNTIARTSDIPDVKTTVAGTGININSTTTTETISVDTTAIPTKNQFRGGLNTVITTANNSVIIDTKTDANSLNYGAYCFVLGQNNELGGANTLLGGQNSTNMGVSNLMMGDSLYAAANSENNILVGNDVRCQGQYDNCNIGVGYNVQYAGSHQKGNAMFGITQNLYGVSAEGNAIFGYNDTVSGNYNMIGGEHNIVSANNTVVFGKDNTVNGGDADKNNNFVIGRSNTVSGTSYDRDNGVLGRSNTIRMGGGSENYIVGYGNSYSGAGYFNYNMTLGCQNILECSGNSIYDNVLIGCSNKIYGEGWGNGIFGYSNNTNGESNTYIVGYQNEIKGSNVLYAGIYGNDNKIETKDTNDDNRLYDVGILGCYNTLKYTTTFPNNTNYYKNYIIGADNEFTNPLSYNIAVGRNLAGNGVTYSYTFGYAISAENNTTKIGYNNNYIKIDGTNAYKVINGTAGVIATINDLSTYLPTSTFNTYTAAHASDDVTPYTAGAGINITNHVISTTDSKYKPVAAGVLDSNLTKIIYTKEVVDYDRFIIQLQKDGNTFRVFLYNHADSNRPLKVFIDGSTWGYVSQNSTQKIYEMTSNPSYLLLNIQIVGYGIGYDLPMYEYNLIQNGSQYSLYKVHEYDV